MQTSTDQRRRLRLLAIGSTIASAAMLALTLTQVLGTQPRALAATSGGVLQVRVAPPDPTAGSPLNAGGSATAFGLAPPTGASCTGDTASGGYRVQSYMVPASVDPSTLTFDADGPIPAGTGAAFRQPLFSTANTPFVNVNTAVAASPGGGGLLTSLPAFWFGVFGSSGPTVVPNGTYNLGYACTKGPAGPNQLDTYWNVQLTVTANAADQPSGLTWTVVDAPPTSATTSTTTTTLEAAGTTTTTSRGSSTTSSTTASSSTVVTTSSTQVASGGGLSSGSGGSGGVLVVTGQSPWALLLWGVLLLVFGRMAILLGRPVRVIPSE